MTVKTFLFNINEINIGHINGYIAKLGEKGFYGEITPLSQNDVLSKDFNGEFKKLFNVYLSVSSCISRAEGYIEELKNGLYVKAFNADEIEQRHFKFQPDLLIEELKKFHKILKGDYNILREFEPNLLMDSLEAWGQNYINNVKWGHEKGKAALEKINNIADLLTAFEIFLKTIYTEVGLNVFLFRGGNIAETETTEILEIRNNYIKISYRLKNINDNILKRITEIKTDRELLIVIGSGKI